MKFKIPKQKLFVVCFLLFVVFAGGFLRFYKLDWGAGYFFHPDEYHLAHAVKQLSFPSQMNPHFFSYGSLTVYLMYFGKLLLETLSSQFSTLNPILIGRFYSAFFSTLTIILVFLVTKKLLKGWFLPCFAAFLTALTPGLIQQAHFSTPESILTFWLFATLFFWFKWLEKKRQKFLYFAAVALGLGLGTKIATLTFLPILLLIPFANLRLKLLKNFIYSIKLSLLSVLILGVTFFLVFPYSLLDWPSFRHSMNYEIGVGRGEPIVFYTRQFINSIPFWFQYQKLLLYALGPAVLLFGTIGLLFALITSIAKITKGKSDYQLLILVVAFLAYFLPNASLFAKWTRFSAPVFPFFVIFSVYLLFLIKGVLTRSNPHRLFFYGSAFLLLFFSFVWGLMFFSIYLRPDVRITATDWIDQNLPFDSFILTESGNMLEIPLHGNFEKVSFDFYHLEEKPELQNRLPQLLTQADYFIIQSRRMFTNHQRLPTLFPKTAKFYQLLFAGHLGFEETKTITSFPQAGIGHSKLEINDERAEETWSVFDHPVIRIYKKTTNISEEDYEQLLAI